MLSLTVLAAWLLYLAKELGKLLLAAAAVMALTWLLAWVLTL